MPQYIQSNHDHTPNPAHSPSTTADPHASLQGLIATRDDERALLSALEQAFDYRGDVTLTLTSNDQLTGYIFDRRTGADLASSTLRVMPAPPHPRAGEKLSIPYADIARVEFSGKDAAHGKTFETWVKKFTESRLAGRRAAIDNEAH